MKWAALGGASELGGRRDREPAGCGAALTPSTLDVGSRRTAGRWPVRRRARWATQQSAVLRRHRGIGRGTDPEQGGGSPQRQLAVPGRRSAGTLSGTEPRCADRTRSRGRCPESRLPRVCAGWRRARVSRPVVNGRGRGVESCPTPPACVQQLWPNRPGCGSWPSGSRRGRRGARAA